MKIKYDWDGQASIGDSLPDPCEEGKQVVVVNLEPGGPNGPIITYRTEDGATHRTGWPAFQWVLLREGRPWPI